MYSFPGEAASTVTGNLSIFKSFKDSRDSISLSLLCSSVI
jgi:hypothetical protein